MSRQEAKQLDREIPWREVDALPTMMRDKYVQSAVSEYEGWMAWVALNHSAKRKHPWFGQIRS